ncbi:polyprenyl synthetase family protein [Patescibacteria group bacterium]|nr:MAG: polyprenyl synthetase family protein [Patescibacteria group bacterium]
MNKTLQDSQILTKSEFRVLVDERLAKLYAAKARQAAKIDASYAQLIEEMAAFVNRGGKRIRPYLMYLIYAGYGGDRLGAALDMAASQELYHNFLLIHDDIIDRDTTRYGGPNIAGRYCELLGRNLSPQEARHFADGIALMAGDTNAGLAFELILKSDFDDSTKVRAAERMTQMIFEVSGGEVLDVLLPLGDASEVTEHRLHQVLHYKTATYSFDAPMQLGAILAGANQEQLNAIHDLAIPVGCAFQLTDDLLGMFGDEKKVGKPVTSDLAEGKRTILMQYGFELADADQRAVLEQHFGDPKVSVEGHAEVKRILEVTGAHAKTQALAASYATKAGQALDRLALAAPAKEALAEIMAFTVSRQK